MPPVVSRAFRTRLHPDMGWGAALLGVLGAIVLPALSGLPFVMNFPDIAPGAPAGTVSLIWFAWHVAAALTVSPMFSPVTVVLATPAVWLSLRARWAGPASLILLAWLIGFPAAHLILHGDVTTEAPGMIPAIATALAIQAVTCWLILRLVSRRKHARATAPHAIRS